MKAEIEKSRGRHYLVLQQENQKEAVALQEIVDLLKVENFEFGSISVHNKIIQISLALLNDKV